MNCHNDEHTRAYLDSKHYPLWHNELQGIASPNSGVSCATCHLPLATRTVSQRGTSAGGGATQSK
jgi:hypothetical protein